MAENNTHDGRVCVCEGDLSHSRNDSLQARERRGLHTNSKYTDEFQGFWTGEIWIGSVNTTSSSTDGY